MGQEMKNQKWLEWEADGDGRIIDKTPFKHKGKLVNFLHNDEIKPRKP